MSTPPKCLDSRLHCALLACLPVLAATSPTPAQAWQGLATADAVAPLTSAIALLAWACTAWLALVVVVAGGGRLPGRLGRGARMLLGRVAPASVRLTLQVVTGVTVAGTVLAGPSVAFADTTDAQRPGTSATVSGTPGGFSLDWPTVGPPATPPSATPVGQPVSKPVTRPASKPMAKPAPTQPAAAITVHAGDTLWDLAAADLVATHPGTQPVASQIARAWPQWWSANRTAIGDDPDLLHPGTHLTRPSS